MDNNIISVELVKCTCINIINLGPDFQKILRQPYDNLRKFV